MILRLVESEKYQVVGEAYVHGLEDSSGLLGRLPPHWRVIICGDRIHGRPMYVFKNLLSCYVVGNPVVSSVLSPFLPLPPSIPLSIRNVQLLCSKE